MSGPSSLTAFIQSLIYSTDWTPGFGQRIEIGTWIIPSLSFCFRRHRRVNTNHTAEDTDRHRASSFPVFRSHPLFQILTQILWGLSYVAYNLFRPQFPHVYTGPVYTCPHQRTFEDRKWKCVATGMLQMTYLLQSFVRSPNWWTWNPCSPGSRPSMVPSIRQSSEVSCRKRTTPCMALRPSRMATAAPRFSARYEILTVFPSHPVPDKPAWFHVKIRSHLIRRSK